MYWRDPTRKTKWTKEGKLVYDDVLELDIVLQDLKVNLRALIRGKQVDGITNKALYDVCKAISLREKVLSQL